MYLNLRPTVCYYQTLIMKLSIHVFFLQSKWPVSHRKSNIFDAHRGNRDMYIASDEWFGPAICVGSWFSGYTLTVYMYTCIYSCGWVTLMCIAVAVWTSIWPTIRVTECAQWLHLLMSWMPRFSITCSKITLLAGLWKFSTYPAIKFKIFQPN